MKTISLALAAVATLAFASCTQSGASRSVGASHACPACDAGVCTSCSGH